MNRQKKNFKLVSHESLAAVHTHTHTLIIGLSDFLTNFKSKKFKKFFHHEKDLINLKNEEKSFNQKFQEKEFKRENYFNQKIFKNSIEKDFGKDFKSNLKTGILSLNSGITLIALIITIIVLLILAGVTISALVRRKWNIKSSNKFS